jgi:ubiquinone/menaquinone biosynthesis C-methylase UbiE
MLNPTFSQGLQARIENPYIAPSQIAISTVAGNEAFDTGGPELRTQPVFGEEIWLKLKRAGFAPDVFQRADVLEVCAGTGFLTYHILKRSRPQHLTVNDISANELHLAKELIDRSHPGVGVDFVLGDMHKIDFGRQFDLIIGNSFIHHFHNVPQVLARIAGMLKKGGTFISLHEPTPMSTVVESAKVAVWPLAVLAPGFINNVARARYKGQPSPTDLWMFEPKKIIQLAKEAGFSTAGVTPWGLARPVVVQRLGLHLSDIKPFLTDKEVRSFRRSIKTDALLNYVLPMRCFGSICLICRR